MKLLWRENGFTLVELLVTLSLFGLLITAAYGFYHAGLKSWNRSVEQLDYQQSARIAMETVMRELRYACAVEIPSEQVIHFQFPGDSRIHLFRHRSRELIYEMRTPYTIISHNKVALDIREARFSAGDNGTVRITIGAGDDHVQYSITSTIRPRNLVDWR